jgi:hypothetical protein
MEHGGRYITLSYRKYLMNQILLVINMKRLERAGHLICASENRMIKKVFNTKPGGTTKVGRSRLRWEECVAGHQFLAQNNRGVWHRIEKNGEQF